MIRIIDRWPIPHWLVRVTLVAATVRGLVLLWQIWSATTSAPKRLCAIANQAPFATFPYPSQAFVFVAIGAYIGGHLSSRYVVAKRSALVAELGTARFERIGVVLVVKLLATGFLLIATILNVYEARAFMTGNWPITYYVWCGVAASPVLGLLGAGILSFLIGRWLWVAD